MNKFDLMSAGEKASSLIKASTLIEALPYLREHKGKKIVIKYGGHAMGNKELSANFSKDIGLLKEVGIKPIIIHGGGPQIDNNLKKKNIVSKFVEGLRVTNIDIINIIEDVLAKKINTKIVKEMKKFGANAVGLAGNKKNLIYAKKLELNKKINYRVGKKNIDLGYVGYPYKINHKLIDSYLERSLIPIIAPLGTDGKNTYNINADTVAGAIAIATKASKLILLTDVQGILNKNKKLIPELRVNEAIRISKHNFIKGGMKPKIITCVEAIKGGVKDATILDGRIPHAIILELFTIVGVGTQIKK